MKFFKFIKHKFCHGNLRGLEKLRNQGLNKQNKPLQYINVSSEYLNDFNKMVTHIATFFRVEDSSQIHRVDGRYQGYLGINKDVAPDFVGSKLAVLESELAKFNSAKAERADRKIDIGGQLKCVPFNSHKTVGGMVTLHLYLAAAINYYNYHSINRMFDYNDYYGMLLDKCKLVEQADNYEIIQLQAEPPVVERETNGMMLARLKHLINRIRQNPYIDNKQIAADIAEGCLKEGANLICDASGATSDPKMLHAVGESQAAFILSAYVVPEAFNNLQQFSSLIKKRIELCEEHSILNKNILLDLPLEMFTSQIRKTIYTNLCEFKKNFNNSLVAPAGLSDCSLENFIKNGTNMIRYNNIDEMEQLSNQVEQLSKYGEQLAPLCSRVEEKPARVDPLAAFRKASMQEVTSGQVPDLVLNPDNFKKEKSDRISKIIEIYENRNN